MEPSGPVNSTLEFTPALFMASHRWVQAISRQALTPGSTTYQLLGFGHIAGTLCAVIGSFMTWDGASLLGSWSLGSCCSSCAACLGLFLLGGASDGPGLAK